MTARITREVLNIYTGNYRRARSGTSPHLESFKKFDTLRVRVSFTKVYPGLTEYR